MHDIWNPWHGCTKISPGCKNCYMYALDERRGVQTPSNQVHKTNNFDYPLKKDRQKNYKIKPGERIRVNMTSDTFLPEADAWRDEMWDIIRKRSDVIFWLLTKRPERLLQCLPKDWCIGYNNVFLNITCENQDMFDLRWPIFEQIPAYRKGFCIAPILSDMNITPALKSHQICEVSLGGENYDNPRPCHYEWVKHISDQCKDYRVNFSWYETGTILYKNGQRYTIPTKPMQAQLAGRAGLNHTFYDVNAGFFLTDPETGRILTDDELYKPVYNSNHCLFCGNQNSCNGCDPKCKSHGPNDQIITLQELKKLQRIEKPK